MIRNKKISIGICIALMLSSLSSFLPVSASNGEQEVLMAVFKCWETSYSSFSELAERSEVVALVEITEKEPGDYITMFTGTVTKALAGAEVGDSISIPCDGVEGKVYAAHEGELMEPGKTYLIFAHRDENGQCYTINAGQGRFIFEDGKVRSTADNSYICPNPRDAEELFAELEEFLASKN